MSKSNRNDPKRATNSASDYTFYEFDKDFPDDASCLDWLVEFLYPDGIYCPKCEKVTKHHRVAARTSYSCQFCGHHEHPMRGTIFESSATSLRLWFHAIFLMSSTRCGISAKQIERELGVTYKTAWRMANLIRTQLMNQDDDHPLSGEIEIDETYVGGKRYGSGQRGRPGRNSNKVAVFGMAQRGGQVLAVVVPDVKRTTLMPHIETRILDADMIYTDEMKSYDHLTKIGYPHRRVNHSMGVWVSGDAHTNSIEGFWALLKGGLKGVYHSVSAKYLQSYLDEYSFRYNHRDSVAGMFATLLGRIEKTPG